jgi:hypothetical protein
MLNNIVCPRIVDLFYLLISYMIWLL